MKIQQYFVNFDHDKIATTEFLVDNPKADVLIMHGAGSADQKRILPLAQQLAEKGHRVITFDFTSHGSSTGKLEELNLERRQKEAEAVANHYSLTNIIVIGFSMSGQTAIDLLPKLNIEMLVLFAPAVYDQKARKAAFGHESAFSKLIRRPNSWENTDAWIKLADFSGKCIIFEGEFDDVIPKDVPPTIYRNLKKTNSKLHIKILGAGHGLAQLIKDEPKKAAWFANIVDNFCSDEPIQKNSDQQIDYEIVAQQNQDI